MVLLEAIKKDDYVAVVLVTVVVAIGFLLGEVDGRSICTGTGHDSACCKKLKLGNCGNSSTSGNNNATQSQVNNSTGIISDIVTDNFFNWIANQCPSDCAGRGFYTRAAYLEAAISFPQFGKGGSTDDTKREIAALFAHFSHETGNFCYIEEIDGSTKNYCDDADKDNSCVPDKKYYGRGPIQLTWNFNYGPAGKDLGFDGLNNPDILSKDPVLSFKTGFRFWMNKCHSLVASGQGFGATIKAINGDLECNGANPSDVNARTKYYTQYCKQLGVDPGDNIRC